MSSYIMSLRPFTRICVVCILFGLVILLVWSTNGRQLNRHVDNINESTAKSRLGKTYTMPQKAREHSKIPRIIHQTWYSKKVPTQMSYWVESWLKFNPEWEYWFWSREDIDALLMDKYPHFKNMSDSYADGVSRADAIRYIILYEFGGFYADLDMECLKPLDELVNNYDCFLTEENYEHVNIIYQRREPIMLNCVMGCRPLHPFYKMVTDGLPARTEVKAVVYATGPMYFTSVFQEYQRQSRIDLADHMTVLPPRYLMPLPDTGVIRGHKNCAKHLQDFEGEEPEINGPNIVHNPSLDISQDNRTAEVCQALSAIKFDVDIPAESLTVHRWVHTWCHRDVWNNAPTTDIKDIVPSFKSYVSLRNGVQISRYHSLKQ